MHDDEPTEADRERKLLADLDGISDYDSWRTMVRWMATQLCRENPRLLAEIVIRRGQMRAADRRKTAFDHEVDEPEIIAQEFAHVGLRIVTTD